MNEGERIREIRASLKMSLETFGEKLGVTRAAMSNIERGQRNLTDQMARSICREYNVNYDYLIYGEGEMFDNLPQTTLDELCKQYNCDELDRSLIEEYLKLDPASRKVLKDYIKNILKIEKNEFLCSAVR